MRIGLISDTHIPGGASELPGILQKAFSGVDMILHAGNVYMSQTLDTLELIAPIKVSGSMDRDQGCADDPRVEETQVMEIEGHKIGMIHDLNLPGFGDRIYPGHVARVYKDNRSGSIIPEDIFGVQVDIAIFGHTCTAMIEEHGDTLLINPGSPTLRNETRRIGTVAILELTNKSRDAQIIDLANLK